jgi:cytochrome c6
MRIDVRALAVAAVFAALSIAPAAQAQDGAALYKTKCVACHGADGTGSAMGKKMGAHDFTSAEVQKMSDEELSGIITGGKNKMPKYATLKPEEVKALVAHIRSLKK